MADTEHACTSWLYGMVSCQLCGHRWVGVWCACADRGGLQCERCEAMAGMPVDEIEELPCLCGHRADEHDSYGDWCDWCTCLSYQPTWPEDDDEEETEAC